MNEQRKIAFCTLGCKLNFSETSTLARKFVDNNFVRVDADEIADVYVVNTCSVTEHADRKCRQLIHKLVKQAPHAIIAVTGCYAQLKPNEIAEIPGVDIVVGADKKNSIFDYVNTYIKGNAKLVTACDINDVDSFFSAFSSGDRTRSFLKVQDGCDYHCAYCTIPMARGRSRNIPVADICNEAKTIAASGIKEIIITGVNIGDFGKTTGETFFDLIRALDKIEGIERYRISSIEPNLLTDEIIEFVAASPKFLPHFHIPLQSGCNRILALMRRRYKREVFAQRIEHIFKVMPQAFIGIDVIVGFPTETDEDFDDTYNFLKSMNPAFLHIFPYSDRANTVTSTMDGKVRDSVKTARVKRLEELCAQLHSNFYKKNIGATANVLFESTRRNELMFGYTENYIKVEIPYDNNLVGQIVKTQLVSIAENGNMIGKIE